MPGGGEPKAGPLRSVGLFAAQALVWFAWLFVAGLIVGQIASAATSGPGHVDAARARQLIGVAMAITAVGLAVAGFVGGFVARRLPRVRSAPFGPTVVALILQFAIAAVQFSPPPGPPPAPTFLVLVPTWLVLGGAVLVGEALTLLVPTHPRRPVEATAVEETFDARRRAD